MGMNESHNTWVHGLDVSTMSSSHSLSRSEEGIVLEISNQ